MKKKISVVIPVYNQAFALSITLFGLCRQSLPVEEFSVVVVDDGSDEPIESVVESYRDCLDIHYLRIEHSGRSVARNKGVEYITDGLVTFCDADRIPRPGFLQEHVEMQTFMGGAVQIGQVRELYVSNAKQNKERIIKYYLSERYDRSLQYSKLVSHLCKTDGTLGSNIPWIASLSGNMSIPVEMYKLVGGFDEQFTNWGFEHFEFGYRAYIQGNSFRYCDKAVNVHIAHPRITPYARLITNSHRYFYEKHKRPVIEAFLDFMLGKINLVQLEMYEDLYKQNIGWDIKSNDSLFVKITNM
ncbi:MAG: glycosyltransferase family 2 protein [Bacillota bacterium]